MEKFNKYSKRKTNQGAKPTPKKCSSLADHGFGAPIGKIVSGNPKYRLIIVNDELMWEHKRTGVRTPFKKKNLSVKTKYFINGKDFWLH